MKVKVLKTFLSGRYEGTKGETPDMPEEVASYLAEIGFIAPVQPEEENPEESEQKEKTAPKRTRKAAK